MFLLFVQPKCFSTRFLWILLMLALEVLNSLAIIYRLKILNEFNLVFASQINVRGDTLVGSLISNNPRDLERQRKIKRQKRIVTGLMILIDM